MKEKIADIKKRVDNLENCLSTNFVSKEIYKIEVSAIKQKIKGIEADITKLNELPEIVHDNREDILGYNKAVARVAWFVVFSVLGAVLAFIYKGGLA